MKTYASPPYRLLRDAPRQLITARREPPAETEAEVVAYGLCSSSAPPLVLSSHALICGPDVEAVEVLKTAYRSVFGLTKGRYISGAQTLITHCRLWEERDLARHLRQSSRISADQLDNERRAQ